ncbi:serine hydrolase [Candidatus Izemoplasma sp. B36]|uniref:serine hydrolase n=1 Tax=Candidatus Izemoplasma sp. B36 TaxID=3242468 RepID=UPI003556E9DA
MKKLSSLHLIPSVFHTYSIYVNEASKVLKVYIRSLIILFLFFLLIGCANQNDIHVVEFETYDGSPIESINIYEGETLQAPETPWLSGYTFDGWFIDNEFINEYDFSNIVLEDIVLHAKWKVNRYTITYKSNGGSYVFSNTDAFNSIITEPLTPTKTGYIFCGWYSDQTFTEPFVFDRMPPNNITLYAKWEMDFDVLLDDYITDIDFNGSVLVYSKGETLFSKGYGIANIDENYMNDTDTVFAIASITKQFTAVLILMLEEQGLLSVDDTIDTYIDDFPNGNTITIHHLLTHTSGLKDYINDFEWTEENRVVYHSLEDLIGLVKYEPLLSTPGEAYHYSNTGYIILGYIIELVTETSFENVIYQNIINPLGLTNTRIHTLEPNIDDAIGYEILNSNENVECVGFHPSITHAAGGLASTVEDLLKWQIALTNYTLISETSTDKMFTPYISILVPNIEGYGYGWLIYEDENNPIVAHTGRIDAFCCFVYHDFENDIIIISMSNNNENKNQDIREYVLDLFSESTE